MPLIPQQDIIVVTGPYGKGRRPEDQAAAMLVDRLKEYPPARIISITGGGILHGYVLTAVVETV